MGSEAKSRTQQPPLTGSSNHQSGRHQEKILSMNSWTAPDPDMIAAALQDCLAPEFWLHRVMRIKIYSEVKEVEVISMKKKVCFIKI